MVFGCKSGWMTCVDASPASPCGRVLGARRSAEAAVKASGLGQMRISGRCANMSKRVRVNIPGVRVNETGCRVLRVIAERSCYEHGRRCAEVQLAHRDIAQAAAVSVPTVIRTLAALRDCELVIVRDNVQPNGARLSNSYELTALGLEVIRMAEELGTFAE